MTWRKPREKLQGEERGGRGHRRAQLQPGEKAEKDWGRGGRNHSVSGPFRGKPLVRNRAGSAVGSVKGKPHYRTLVINRIGQIKDGRPSWACLPEQTAFGSHPGDPAGRVMTNPGYHHRKGTQEGGKPVEVRGHSYISTSSWPTWTCAVGFILRDHPGFVLS